MPAYVLTGPRRAVQDAGPGGGLGEVVVDVERVGVHGTDLESFTGDTHLHQGVRVLPDASGVGGHGRERRGVPRLGSMAECALIDWRLSVSRRTSAPTVYATVASSSSRPGTGVAGFSRCRGYVLPSSSERVRAVSISGTWLNACVVTHQALGPVKFSDSPTSLHRPNSRSNTPARLVRRPIRA